MRSRWLIAVAACGSLLGATLTSSAAEPGAAPPGPGPMALQRLRGMIEKMRAEGKSDAEVLRAVTQALERWKASGRGVGPNMRVGRGLGAGRGLGVRPVLGLGPGSGLGRALGTCPACPLVQKARAQAMAKVRKMIAEGKGGKEIRAAIREMRARMQEKIRARVAKLGAKAVELKAKGKAEKGAGKPKAAKGAEGPKAKKEKGKEKVQARSEGKKRVELRLEPKEERGEHEASKV
ncbi:MAG: hypothetical protein ACUVYA_00570 [Planctomycetota bacterium]